MNAGTDTSTILGLPAILQSEAMQDVMRLARRIASTNATVLVTGESGVGKELVARAVHHYSPRVKGAWVDVSCATLPENLVESELFGYEKGAFSGALSSKAGLFELANGGTLFLDEIGELDLRTQSKLLRILDGMPFFRLGSTRKSTTDARVVAATNRDLTASIREGQFREDLYHRLSQFTMHVPPLRERVADIVPLALFFLEQQPGELHFSDAALELLEHYHWPGNIRELRNVVVKAAVWTEGPEIRAEDLQLERRPIPEPDPDERPATHGPCLETLERETILRALARAGGHQQRAAQMLGISRRTLSRRLKAYHQRE